MNLFTKTIIFAGRYNAQHMDWSVKEFFFQI